MACETIIFIAEYCKIKESECTASDQPFRWRCVLRLNSRWYNKHSWNVWRGKRLELSNKSRIKVHVVLRFFRSLMSSSAGTARQNKFVLIYIVELSKPYRIVFESWESVQAKQIVPLFTRVYFFRVCETHAAKQLPRSSWTSPGYKSNTTEQQKSSSFC